MARRDWTRRWWSTAAERFDLVTSEAVLVELVGADATRSALRLSLLDHVPLLPIVPEIADVVATYIRRKLMPADPAGDALHLAIASFHRCDFLVTWNCRHIANANKFGRIRILNSMLGIHVPDLVTPLELMGNSDAFA